MKRILLIILLSAAIGCEPVEKEVVEHEPEEPKIARNIIFMIGDGMGISQITAAMIANQKPLNLERFPVVGLIKTSAKDDLITDSAAGATAFATGEKVNNGVISLSEDGKPLKTILELFHDKGSLTGLAVTSTIVHATPACFVAHRSYRYMYEEIAWDIAHSDLDLFIGGGKKYFNQRSDSINLFDSLRSKGILTGFPMDSIEHGGPDNERPNFFDNHPPSMIDGRGDYLQIAASKSISYLNSDGNGFFLMIEGSQIDWGGHANDMKAIIAEMIDFDEAIGIAYDFAEKDGNTLLVVTADHETGGFAINSGKLNGDSLVGGFTTIHHTPAMIPVFAFGPGAELFSGVYDNTEIFHKFKQASGIKD
ncbi:MAG: alkaline phosphatase [Bacteroidetes bacterium]|nr:alkaline phosphatase [Bacteroidota bacterium]